MVISNALNLRPSSGKPQRGYCPTRHISCQARFGARWPDGAFLERVGRLQIRRDAGGGVNVSNAGSLQPARMSGGSILVIF